MSDDRLTLTALEDEARGLVWLAPQDLAARSLSPGDTVQLTGGAETYARAVPGPVEPGELRMGQATARNCGTEQGARVAVSAQPLAEIDVLTLEVPENARPLPSELIEALFDMALSTEDQLRVPLPNRAPVTLRVVSAGPAGAGLVGDATTVNLALKSAGARDYEGIGGLAAQIAQVHEIVATPLLRRDLFDRLGVPAPRGILFAGPPGSGKTLLARQVAARTKAAFFQIDGPEILSKHYGDSEAALRRIFQAAQKAQPAIVFIDEIDAIAPRRAELSSEKQVERRIVAQLLTLMDGLGDRGQIVVMAATNLPNGLDPALRRPGRFDREILFTPPTGQERSEILKVHLANAPLAADVALDRIADASSGYVGADLAALAREAAMAALARSIREAGSEAAVDADALWITQADLLEGLANTSPSALRASAEVPKGLHWNDIGGLENAKSALRQAVEWPRKHRDKVKALGLRPPRGILLAGPPGSGKTMLARALAGEAALNFILVRPPDLLSQFLGQAERAVADLFSTARQTAPSLLFFDELDALAPRRGGDGVFDRIVAQLLVEIDGITSGGEVTILGATNRAAAIDPALLRPGRFDRVIDIPNPAAVDRAAILGVHLARRSGAECIDREIWAARTEGLSGADIAGLVETAGWRAVGRAVQRAEPPALSAQDLEDALTEFWDRQTHLKSDFIRQPEPTR